MVLQRPLFHNLQKERAGMHAVRRGWVGKGESERRAWKEGKRRGGWERGAEGGSKHRGRTRGKERAHPK